jgi:hypothetical protein
MRSEAMPIGSWSAEAAAMAKDIYGVEYGTYGGNAPTSGTPIVIKNADGSTSHGTWMGQALKN